MTRTPAWLHDRLGLPCPAQHTPPLDATTTYWAAQQNPERVYMEYIKEFIHRQKRIATLPAGWFEPVAEWNKIP